MKKGPVRPFLKGAGSIRKADIHFYVALCCLFQWPFIRVLGLQEPASVIFSVLNLMPHVIMMVKFRRSVPSKAPMYYIWHAYAVVS